MRTVTRIGGSNGDSFLDFSDYKRILGSICEENGWDYETFRDYIFFNEQCFNIKDRQELKSKLEKRKLPISKLKQYALAYEQ